MSMKPFSSFWLYIDGARWRFRFVKSSQIPPDRWGDCDPPSNPKRTIRVREALKAKDRLETVIHEVLHAQHPYASEQTVQQQSLELSRLLWRLGYRRVET